MKNIRLLLVLLIGFALTQESFSQSKLCVCFEKGNKYIEIEKNENSTHTDFSIVKFGYETESDRKKALKEYRKTALENSLGPPNFYIFYFSMKKPVELNSMEDIHCTDLVSLKEFRHPEFKRLQNTNGNLFIFIQKISENKFLKWEVVKNVVKNTRE